MSNRIMWCPWPCGAEKKMRLRWLLMVDGCDLKLINMMGEEWVKRKEMKRTSSQRRILGVFNEPLEDPEKPGVVLLMLICFNNLLNVHEYMWFYLILSFGDLWLYLRCHFRVCCSLRGFLFHFFQGGPSYNGSWSGFRADVLRLGMVQTSPKSIPEEDSEAFKRIESPHFQSI